MCLKIDILTIFRFKFRFQYRDRKRFFFSFRLILMLRFWFWLRKSQGMVWLDLKKVSTVLCCFQSKWLTCETINKRLEARDKR